MMTCVWLLLAMTVFYEYMCTLARQKLSIEVFGVHGGVDTVQMPFYLKCMRGFMIVRLALNFFYYVSWSALAVAVDEDTATNVMQFLTVGMYASFVTGAFILMMVCLAGVITLI